MILVRRRNIVGTAFLALVVLFLWYPMVELAWASLSQADFLQSERHGNPSLRWLAIVMLDPTWWRSITISAIECLSVGVCAAAVGTLLGVLNRNSGGARLLIGILAIPFLIPPIVQVVSLATVFGPLFPGLVILWMGLMVGNIGIAFFIVQGAAGRVTVQHERAAALLGESGTGFLLAVVAPAAKGAIALAIVLCCFFVLDDVLYSLYFGGPEFRPVARLVWERIHNDATPWIAAASTLFTGSIIVVAFCFRRTILPVLLR